MEATECRFSGGLGEWATEWVNPLLLGSFPTAAGRFWESKIVSEVLDGVCDGAIDTAAGSVSRLSSFDDDAEE
jgi:hypothetical protein